MGVEPIFFDVEDTPMFRQKVHELEGSAKRLKERCSNFVASAKKYRDSLAMMQEAQAAFSTALADFCGNADDESLLMGSAVMGRFVTVFKEMSSYFDLLRAQVDSCLLEKLQESWLDQLLANVKEDHKRFETRARDHEYSRAKWLSLKKGTRKEVLDKAYSEMSASRSLAEGARFDLARRLNEVDGRKRWSFIDLYLTLASIHQRFFSGCSQLLERLEPYTKDAQDIIDHLKGEQEGRKKKMDDMILLYMQQTAHKEQLEKEQRDKDNNLQGSTQGASTGDMDSKSPSVAPAFSSIPTSAAGPLQMSATKAALVTEFESFIRTTQSGAGQQVTVLKQGYLYKKSKGSKGRSDWKRRFFVLDSQGMLYYYSHKDSGMLNHRAAKPKNTVNLLTSTVKLDDEEAHVRFAFRVISPEGRYTLKSEGEVERQEWVEALQVVINCLLTGPHDPNTMPKVPRRATHSRTNSIGDTDIFQTPPPAAAPADSHPSPYTPGASVSAASYSGGGGQVMGLRTIPSDASLSGPSSSPPTVLDHPLLGPNSALITPPSLLTSQSSLTRSEGMKWKGNVLPPIERLRRIPGNRSCVDCGAAEPDWASLNLGVVMCIECSGIHRQLGVHISKVRSCTLDVKVWEPPVMEMFEALGNECCNQVWESQLQGSTFRKADSWVWCEESDDEGTSAAGTVEAPGVLTVQSNHKGYQMVPTRPGTMTISAGAQASVDDETLTVSISRPGPQSPVAEKQKFIIQKYVNRAFVAVRGPDNMLPLLWDAVELQDVRAVMKALVLGADINAAYRTPRAFRLVKETHAIARGVAEHDCESPRACGNVTLLHAACAGGDAKVVEFLLQNGASVTPKDAYMRTPLHYCLLHDRDNIAKMILRRGADVAARDSDGLNAMDVAMSKGRISDEELFVLLSKS